MRAARLGLLAAAILLSAQSVFAGAIDKHDMQLFNDVSKSVNRYAFFSISDDVNAQIQGDVVTLTGKVTQPYKKTDLGKQVAKVQGVGSVVNNIEVLPLSSFDDSLRYRIARSIYGNSNFWNYAIMANPPIHIVVDRGRVTLTGVVQSNVDRALARSLATQFGAFSITNDLKTDAEIREQLEKS